MACICVCGFRYIGKGKDGLAGGAGASAYRVSTWGRWYPVIRVRYRGMGSIGERSCGSRLFEELMLQKTRTKTLYELQISTVEGS